MEDIIVKSLIIKSLIGLTIGLGFCGPTHAAESDSIATPTDSVITVEATPDTLPACSADIHGSTDHSEPVTPYTRRTERFRRGWDHLIPNQTSFQVAGGIGAFSIGIGWYYGRREQWETDVLWGFVPKANGDDMHQTLTVKQRFVPWHLPLFKSHRWTAEPLTAGAFINSFLVKVFGRKPLRNTPKAIMVSTPKCATTSSWANAYATTYRADTAGLTVRCLSTTN